MKGKKTTKNDAARSTVEQIKSNSLFLKPKYSICGPKESRFLKEQETKGLLTSLEIETLLSKILFVGNLIAYLSA